MKVVVLSCEYVFVLCDVLLLLLLFLCGWDLLVWIEVVLVNLVDVKQWVVIDLVVLEMSWVFGWDVVGVVEVIGDEVSLFVFGDEVYFVGDVICLGCNVQY